MLLFLVRGGQEESIPSDGSARVDITNIGAGADVILCAARPSGNEFLLSWYLDNIKIPRYNMVFGWSTSLSARNGYVRLMLKRDADVITATEGVFVCRSPSAGSASVGVYYPSEFKVQICLADCNQNHRSISVQY